MSTPEHRARKAADQRRSRARRTQRPLRAPGESDRWDKPYLVLNTAEVDALRRLHARGRHTQAALADMFGIHASHVSRIVRKQRR